MERFERWDTHTHTLWTYTYIWCIYIYIYPYIHMHIHIHVKLPIVVGVLMQTCFIQKSFYIFLDLFLYICIYTLLYQFFYTNIIQILYLIIHQINWVQELLLFTENGWISPSEGASMSVRNRGFAHLAAVHLSWGRLAMGKQCMLSRFEVLCWPLNLY